MKILKSKKGKLYVDGYNIVGNEATITTNIDNAKEFFHEEIEIITKFNPDVFEVIDSKSKEEKEKEALEFQTNMLNAYLGMKKSFEWITEYAQQKIDDNLELKALVKLRMLPDSVTGSSDENIKESKKLRDSCSVIMRIMDEKVFSSGLDKEAHEATFERLFEANLKMNELILSHAEEDAVIPCVIIPAKNKKEYFMIKEEGEKKHKRITGAVLKVDHELLKEYTEDVIK